MIKLHAQQPAWELADGSVFVTKLDCYLRMAGLPYVLTAARSIEVLQRAPFGMIPYIEDRGKKIGDSDFIIDYLRRTYGAHLGDSRLSPAERAVSHSMRRMLEENLYWVLLYLHWMETGAHKASMADAMRMLQNIERQSPEAQVQYVVRGYLYAKGIGRQSKEELYSLGKADISALSSYLGDKMYFTGDFPSSLDASAYAILSRVLQMPLSSPIQDYARSLKNIQEYCLRMWDRYYGRSDAAWPPFPEKNPLSTAEHDSSKHERPVVAWRNINESAFGCASE